MVAIEGWVETSSLSALNFGQQMKSLGVQTAVFTDVSRDGRLQGPNLASIEAMARNTGLQIIASGGVTSREDLRNLKAMEELGVCGIIDRNLLFTDQYGTRLKIVKGTVLLTTSISRAATGAENHLFFTGFF